MIDSGRLSGIFEDCLSQTKEGEGVIVVEGVVCIFVFDKAKIKQHANEIKSMLAQLPNEFMKDTGGGYSFLNMCMTKDGEQWTGLHLMQEYLLTLGIAMGLLKILFPREYWSIFPDGVPYVVCSLNREEGIQTNVEFD